MYAAYAANPTANAAVSPGSRTNKLIQPKRKAVRGPKLSRRYTYAPPALGKRPASSPKQSAPLSVMEPTPSQTMSSQKGEARDLAMPAGVRKMPTAIASPATTAAAEPKPSWRRRPSCGAGVVPVTDAIRQWKRTAPCVYQILARVRRARCESLGRARETRQAPNAPHWRWMISLRTSQSRGYPAFQVIAKAAEQPAILIGRPRTRGQYEGTVIRVWRRRFSRIPPERSLRLRGWRRAA